jgi:hypothetical protein
MVLTITNTISVYTAGRVEVARIIVAVLGCNLAWGVVDGGFYLMGCLEERGRALLAMRTVRQARASESGRRTTADMLPDWLTAMLSPEDLEPLGPKLHDLPDAPARALRLRKTGSARSASACWSLARPSRSSFPFCSSPTYSWRSAFPTASASSCCSRAAMPMAT